MVIKSCKLTTNDILITVYTQKRTTHKIDVEVIKMVMSLLYARHYEIIYWIRLLRTTDVITVRC